MASTIMESFFQRTLDDLVKGLRVQIIGEGRYLAKALEEVKKEIKSTDAHTKVVALQKLTYLNMLQGADMGWASFHVVEVMSMPKFMHKKVGYLAASQSFYEGTDVLVLITNLLRKDLCSKNEYEAGLALDCLSRIATPDLARDLTPDLFTMLASTRVYVRKKATLVLLRIFCKYPEAIRVAFKRLVERMEDPDGQVVSAAVSVLCELALKDPKAYLPLAPDFYRLLAGSSNNWMCIKLVKIFGVLAPLEPRLARKIVEPICDHLQRTSAKSLLLECIRTVTAGLLDHPAAVKLSGERLRELLLQDDPNLRYLGLQSLASIMPFHPWAVAENKGVIVKCLDDGDMSIQMASLRLIMGMVTESNLVETVEVLLQYVSSAGPKFCNELVSCILSTCSRALYELVSDFTWYVNVLGEVARFPHHQHGEEVGRQLMDIGLRVVEAREDLVRVARYLLLDPALLGSPSLHAVLSAAAWVSGEYVSFSHNAYELIECLLQPRTCLLPPAVHAVYLQAVLKVFTHFSLSYMEEQEQAVHAAGMECTPQEVSRCVPGAEVDESGSRKKHISSPASLSTLVKLLEENVTPLADSVSMEVQERACNILGLLQALYEAQGCLHKQTGSVAEACSAQGVDILRAMASVFGQEMGPVSVYAQERVCVPEGLILESSLDSLGPIEGVDEGVGGTSSGQQPQREWDDGPIFTSQHKPDAASTTEGTASLAEHRQRNESYYLPKDPTPVNDLDYPPPSVMPQEEVTTTGSRLGQDVLTLPNNAKLKKPTKVRPVVVKLDEESIIPEVKGKKVLKDELLSNAIRDVLTADSKHKIRTAPERQEEPWEGCSSARHPRRSRSSKTSGHPGDTQNPAESRCEQGSGEGGAQQHKGWKNSKEKKKVVEDGPTELREQVKKESGKHKSRHSGKHHKHRRARSSIQIITETTVKNPDYLL